MAISMFSKKLKKTDIEKRLSFPIKALETIPRFNEGENTVDFKVRDEAGLHWNFVCSTRKKKHLKPVLSKGWRKFVSTRQLKIDDKVEFLREVEKANSVRYYVRVERPVTVFGKVLGHAPLPYSA